MEKIERYFALLPNEYKRLCRFAIVGVINTGVDFLVFTVLSSLVQLHYSYSQIAGYTAGVLNSFILNKLWTFDDKGKNVKTMWQFVKFSVVNLVSLYITIMFLGIFVDKLGINLYISKIVVTLFAQVINFAGYRFWVFNKKGDDKKGA